MRTKALLCAAGLLVAGAATSMAQNVYSLNVVGYINTAFTNGFNMWANQLDLDGTGINNTVTNVFGTNMPVQTRVYAFNPATQTYFNTATYAGNGNWLSGAAVKPGLQPGSGVWVQLPTGQGTPTPLTVTFTGNVLQGNHAIPVVGAQPNKFQIASLTTPTSVGIETGLLAPGQPAAYPAQTSDAVYFYNAIGKAYFPTRTRTPTAGSWLNNEPVPAIAQAFWLSARGSKTWNQNYTVP